LSSEISERKTPRPRKREMIQVGKGKKSPSKKQELLEDGKKTTTNANSSDGEGIKPKEKLDKSIGPPRGRKSLQRPHKKVTNMQKSFQEKYGLGRITPR